MSIKYDPSKDWDRYYDDQDRALAEEARVRRVIGDRVSQITCTLLRVYGLPFLKQTDDNSIQTASAQADLIVTLAVKIATKIHYECEGFFDG